MHVKRLRILVVQFTVVLAAIAFSGCKQEPPKPELPVKLIVRESFVGEGYVVQFHNECANRLVLTVSIENRTGSRRICGSLPIAGGEMTEVGWMEGWKFQTGDNVILAHDGFQPSSYSVP